MTEPTSRADLARVLVSARCLLFDFDGPVCDLFAGTPARSAAERLRTLLADAGARLPESAATTDDPFEILRASPPSDPASPSEQAAELTTLELHAVTSAAPAPYIHEAISACRSSGRLVAIVSTTSDRAIAAYLTAHDLDHAVSVATGRADSDPGRLMPDPYPIEKTLAALNARPDECALIATTPTTLHAAHRAGIPAIGYARHPGAPERLTAAGASVVLPSLADLALRLRAHPLPD